MALLRRLILYWPFLFCLLLGLVAITGNILGLGLEFLPGDFIDGRFNNYVLEHGYSFLTGQTASYWSAPFIYPERDVITYSDNLLGTLPIYSLFRLVGAPYDTAFQLWMLTLTVFNFVGCGLLLNYLFKNNYAAALGAFVFAFSMALQSQVGHAQTFPRFAIPLAVLSLLVFYANHRPIYFFLALLLWVYQMYCGIYLGFMLMVLISCMILFQVIIQQKSYLILLKNRKWVMQVLVSVAINLAILLPLMIPYLERAKQTGLHSFEQIRESILTPVSYFFSWSGSYFWDGLNETAIAYPAFWDHQIFAGGMATLALLIVLIRLIYFRFRKNLRSTANANFQILSLSAIAVFLIFMRFGNYSLYQLVFHVPGFAAMRALQRIINIELVFFSIALAYLINCYLKDVTLKNAFLFMLLAITLTLDNYVYGEKTHHRSKNEARERVEQLVKKMERYPAYSIISYEPDTLLSAPMDYQLDAMLASQKLHLFSVNGYTGTSPDFYSPYWVKPNSETRLFWLKNKAVSPQSVLVVR